MIAQKHIDKICVLAVVLAMVIAVLFMNGEKLGIKNIVDEDRESFEATDHFTSNDLNSASFDFSDAVKITLDNDRVSIQGNGAYVLNNTVRIVKSGYYTISGNTDRYQIVVDAEDYSKVWLQLNGVTIQSANDSALQVENADKVFLVLAEGTENTFSSDGEYSGDAKENGHDGTIFSRDDITITGSGSLAVTGSEHGIVSNDELVITGGWITVNAGADGLHANDSIRICNVNLSITAKDEGIQADEEGSDVYIESGTLNIQSTGDSIKSAGDLKIKGGDITISTEDDGIRSDTAVYIYGGNILINDCYEGIEAKYIEIYDGDITIYPSDDGINANGGTGFGFGNFGGGFNPMDRSNTDSSSEESPSSSSDPENNSDFDPSAFQKTNEETSSETEEETTYIRIDGGRITIVNESAIDADGIDSNGDVIINGGDIRIFLNGSGTNNAIDYGSESGGSATISGGTLIASGSYNMAESFDSSSQQASIMYNISSGIEAGKEMSLTDEEGNVLISAVIPCSYTSVIISCPELTVGNSYTLILDDMEETIAVEETSASYGDAKSSMFGGTMNFGGMRKRDDSSFQSGNMPENGDFPTPPDMTEEGSMPDFSEMPDFNGFPDADSSDSARPSRPGNRPGGNRPDSGNTPSSSEDTGTSQEEGEAGQSEERPSFSEMGDNGTMPDFSQMPDFSGSFPEQENTLPESGTDSENGEKESNPSEGDFPQPPEMKEGGSMPEFSGMNGFENSSEEETADQTAADSASAMILTIASVLVLLGGILFAKFFRGKHISS